MPSVAAVKNGKPPKKGGKKGEKSAPQKGRAVPKQAPKKKSSKPNSSRQSAYGAYNPLSTKIPPSTSIISNVFPVNQTYKVDFDTAVSHDYLVLCSGIGGAGTQGVIIDINNLLPAAVAGFTLMTLPLLSAPSSSSGCTSSKISKAGLRLLNATPPLYAGGSRYYVAHIGQRLKLPAAPGSMLNSDWANVLLAIKGLPPSMVLDYGADAFGSNGIMGGKSMYCKIVDDVDYSLFENNDLGTLSANQYMQHISVWPSSTESTRAMDTVAIIISGPSATTFAQNLVINLDAQLLTRWPLDTVPGVSSGLVAPSSTDVVNRARMGAEMESRGGTR